MEENTIPEVKGIVQVMSGYGVQLFIMTCIL
jgi:hypothetical protein